MISIEKLVIFTRPSHMSHISSNSSDALTIYMSLGPSRSVSSAPGLVCVQRQLSKRCKHKHHYIRKTRDFHAAVACQPYLVEFFIRADHLLSCSVASYVVTVLCRNCGDGCWNVDAVKNAWF